MYDMFMSIVKPRKYGHKVIQTLAICERSNKLNEVHSRSNYVYHEF
jgi:hypothetical protein